MNNEQPLLQFPCEFMIKAVGNASDDFADLVLSLVKQHAPDTQDTQISLKESGKGNFLSATVKIHAFSQQQLDNIYRTLTSHEQIKFVL
ncbi:MAG: DUF493 domain-containing protein [Neisseriaceae bacterium]|nr:DUF493 domain-containing protein [Neisseriaceae bacterium]